MAGKLPRVRSKRRRRLRSHRWLAITLIVVIGLGASGTALGYLGLKPRVDKLQANLAADLEAGQSALEAGKTALTQANSKHDPALVTQASADFVSANGHFMAASHLADTSSLLRYAQLTPGLGDFARSRHTAVDGIAQMGAGIADAGLAVTSLYSQLIKPQPTSHNFLTVLNEVQAALPGVRGDLLRAQAGAAQVDLQVLPSAQQAAFVKARDTVASGLAGLDEFEHLTPTLTEVLGGNGPRTYLVEQVNPAELRAGGGFIGTYSLLQTKQGSIKLIQSGNAYDLVNPRPTPGQPGFIPQPTPYREVVPDISWSFVDSNIYPDFASNAKAAETFVQPRVGTHLDGVISIDYFAVAKMLELTGPISVPGYAEPVTASNFIPQLMQHDLAADVAHKAILAALAEPLMKRISSLSADDWPHLISSVEGLATERHFQVYLDNPAGESELDRIAWSGALNPTGITDFMMEVESNYYGTKSNYFLTRLFTITLSREGGTLHHKVVVDTVNNEPIGTEERVTYEADTRLYLGKVAAAISDNLQSVRFSNPAPPSSFVMSDGWLIDGCCGSRAEAVFEYDTPWVTDAGGAYEIYWQKQPGTANDSINLTWLDGTGTTQLTVGTLTQDQIITLTPAGAALSAGHPAQVTLPSLSLG